MAKKELTNTSRDYTINLHKRCHKTQFKQKTTKAVREIKKFAEKNMLTSDVRIAPELNQFIWSQGVRNLPHRVRVRISRKRNEEEGSTQGEFYSLVQHVHVEDFSNKLTVKAKVSA